MQLKNNQQLSHSQKILLIEKFRREHGLPILTWLKFEEKLTPPYLDSLTYWDFICSHPQSVFKDKFFDKAIYLAEVRIKNTLNKEIILKEKNKIPVFSDDFHLDPILLIADTTQTHEKKPQLQEASPLVYFVPKGERPIILHYLKLTFLNDVEGLFYGLQIHHNGSWKISEVPSVKAPPMTITCPDKLVDYFQKNFNHQQFYSHYNCQQIQDQGTQKNFILLIPQSC